MKRLVPEVVSFLESYSWPDNVRELENLIERIVAVEERETVTLASLPADILGTHRRAETPIPLKPGFNLEEHLDQISKKYLQEAGAAANGNMKKMAALLGISYRSLRYLLDKYEIKSFKKTEALDRREPTREF
jgi:two-component system response regulator PilR (NtrC family)